MPGDRLLRAALALATRRAHVFPCVARGKTPATVHGVKDATIDPTTIARWWWTNPDYNIAIATGAISNVFVVDVDGIDAEAELRKLEAEHGALPATVEVITARGRHIWFVYPAETTICNSVCKIGPGIDVRGDNGYALVPPSMHPSGKLYCWSVDSANAIAEAPAWLLAKIVDSADASGATAPSEWRRLVIVRRRRRRAQREHREADWPFAAPLCRSPSHARIDPHLERDALPSAAAGPGDRANRQLYRGQGTQTAPGVRSWTITSHVWPSYRRKMARARSARNRPTC